MSGEYEGWGSFSHPYAQIFNGKKNVFQFKLSFIIILQRKETDKFAYCCVVYPKFNLQSFRLIELFRIIKSERYMSQLESSHPNLGNKNAINLSSKSSNYVVYLNILLAFTLKNTCLRSSSSRTTSKTFRISKNVIKQQNLKLRSFIWNVGVDESQRTEIVILHIC